jgi:N-acetylmuramoyl-L-alanine amidase
VKGIRSAAIYTTLAGFMLFSQVQAHTISEENPKYTKEIKKEERRESRKDAKKDSNSIDSSLISFSSNPMVKKENSIDLFEIVSNIKPSISDIYETKGRIIIDPGHCKEFGGFTIFGYKEEELNLQIAYKIKEKLEEQNYKVFLTRTGESGLNTNRLDLNNDKKVNKSDEVLIRAKYIQDAQVDAVLAIHIDALTDRRKLPIKTAEGIRMHIYGLNNKSHLADGKINSSPAKDLHIYSKSSKKLSDAVQSSFAKYGISSSIWGSDMTLLVENSNKPMIYLELGFMTNPNDLEFITSEYGQNKVAESIADAFSDKELILSLQSPKKNYSK